MRKKLTILGIIALMLGFGGVAFGNPGVFTDSAKSGSSTATTSPTYMMPGKATTTATYDSDATQASNTYVPTMLTALIHVSATTGVPTLNINCEYSRDGIDYYKGDCYDTSTTTNTANLAYMSSYTWIVATNTDMCSLGGNPTGLWTDKFCTRAFEVRPLATHTRLVMTLSSTTALSTIRRDDADIYVELVPKKEVR